jgi:alpha-tubulin suppressor-like RCC1 family protein
MGIKWYLQGVATAATSSGNYLLSAGRGNEGYFGHNIDGAAGSTIQNFIEENNRFDDIEKVISCYQVSAILRDIDGLGTLVAYVAGDNPHQNLNTGDTTDRYGFIEFLGGNSGCIDFAVAGGTSPASHIIKEDGTLWGVGSNSSGKLGVGDTTNRTVLTQESSGFTDWEKIFPGGLTTFAIRNSGDLYACGSNSYGKYGIGNTISKNTFVYITGDIKCVIGGSETSHLITNGGELYSTGRNQEGQLGVGDTTQRTTWIQEASGFTDWVSVATEVAIADNAVVALRSDGSVWTWGDALYYKLGDGQNSVDVLSPQQILPGSSGVTSIAMSDRHAFAVDDQNRMLFWGDDGAGQDGTTNNYTAEPPTINDEYKTWIKTCVGSNRSASQLIANRITTFAAGEGRILHLGDNSSKQAGNDTTIDSLYAPTNEINGWINFKNIRMTTNHAIAYRDGIPYVVGENGSRQCNDGTTTDVGIWKEFLGGGSGALDAECGFNCSHIIKDDGTLWGIGNNTSGKLGVGDTTQRTVLTQESSGWTDWSKVFSGYEITAGLRGTDLYICGENGYQQLGLDNGTTTDEHSFVYVTGDVSKCKPGHDSTLLLKTNGEIWGVGRNFEGSLGVGDALQKTSWTQEASGFTWIDFDFQYSSSRDGHVAAIRDDGTLWGWGYGSANNENGTATGVDETSPKQLLPAASGTFTKVSLGSVHGYAIDSSGNLWFWGSDGQGGIDGNNLNQTELQPPRLANNTLNWLEIKGGNACGIGIAQ